MNTSHETTAIMKNPLIAVVCDIRGFTDFTSTIDSINRSDHIPDRVKPDLLEFYDTLVRESQEAALQKILGPMAEELRRPQSELNREWIKHSRRVVPLPCALKSTGDGFLVAVELVHDSKPVKEELQRALAVVLTRGVTNLVRQAADGGQFRKLIRDLFTVWEELLALWIKDETFRIAAAIAIGTGQVSNENVPPKWRIADFLTKKNLLGNPPVLELKGDAYGHGVNLAFRLCDRAGRPKKKKMSHGKMGPYILLDRRIGQLLIDVAPTPTEDGQLPFKMKTFTGYLPTRFVFDEPLKGIDELWCYALDDEDPKKSPGKTSAPDSAALEITLDAFIEMATSCGLTRRPPQRLVVPYFHGEFNRCVEHRDLNDLLGMPVDQGGSGWYQIGMACRINDTKKVEFGWHTTVFEMLTAIWRQEPGLVERGQNELATAVVEFLTGGLGLDLKRLRVTYFGGGEVIPGLTLEPDEAGRSAFTRVGLSAMSLVPVRGPKNFVLFVGDGERTGPKYEIQYLLSNNGSERWIEVATAIVDCYQWERRPDTGKWSLRRPQSALTGCAFGVERLTAAQLGAGNVWVSPVLHDLLAATQEASTQDTAAEELLRGDRLILAESSAIHDVSAC